MDVLNALALTGDWFAGLFMQTFVEQAVDSQQIWLDIQSLFNWQLAEQLTTATSSCGHRGFLTETICCCSIGFVSIRMFLATGSSADLVFELSIGLTQALPPQSVIHF